MKIAFCRVEERLIHGQITVAWSRSVDFDAFVVVDNAAAADEFMQSILEMGIPAGKKLYIFSEEEAVDKINQLEETIFILAKSPITFMLLREEGLKFDYLNIGSIHAKKGKKEIYQTVYMSDQEIDAIKRLLSLGVQCDIQKLPNESKTNISTIIK